MVACTHARLAITTTVLLGDRYPPILGGHHRATPTHDRGAIGTARHV